MNGSVRLVLAGLAIVLAVPARAETVEEIVELPSAAGSRMAVLLSHDSAAAPRAVAVLFTGGGGAVGLGKGIPQPGRNFLVRSRSLFVQQGIATAVPDVPSDRAELTDGERMSRRHADDVHAVVELLRSRHPGVPVFLVGTSRGTVSAAYAGAALGSGVDGVVLSSTVFRSTRGGPGVAGFDWGRIGTPLLFVHHVDDACQATPYDAAARLAAAGRALVSVHGGDAPRSGPCEPFAPHGFLGVEPAVVDAIARWMRGESPPIRVP